MDFFFLEESRLRTCEESFKKSYGPNLERLKLIKVAVMASCTLEFINDVARLVWQFKYACNSLYYL